MNCFGIFDNNNVETRRTSKTGKQGEVARRASSIALSCMLGFTMLISPVTVRAEGGQPRSLNNSVNYTLAGETDGVLDYSTSRFSQLKYAEFSLKKKQMEHFGRCLSITKPSNQV